jgi:hypothetical protein
LANADGRIEMLLLKNGFDFLEINVLKACICDFIDIIHQIISCSQGIID